jgi:hypothetical protein
MDEPSIVEWQGPPPPKRHPKFTDWYAIAEQLRSKPGEWAYLGRCPAGSAKSINSGHLMAFRPEGDYEATSRFFQGNLDQEGVGPTAEIWARYVGDLS